MDNPKQARARAVDSDAGMTLIELMMAISIFSITVILMVGSLGSIARLGDSNSQAAEVNTQLSGVVEEIQGTAFSDILSEEYQYPIPLGMGVNAYFELACYTEEGTRILLPPEDEQDEEELQALDEPVEIEVKLVWQGTRGIENEQRAVAAVWR